MFQSRAASLAICCILEPKSLICVPTSLLAFGFWLCLHLALGFWFLLALGFGFTWLLAFGFWPHFC